MNKKINLIFNYYNVYKKYSNTKENDINLKLKDFIGSYCTKEDRISEKLKICYEFIKELFDDNQNNDKDNIKKILIKCKLSINKLYKIRGDNYNTLIKFIKKQIASEITK
jgi:hypothetical protein